MNERIKIDDQTRNDHEVLLNDRIRCLEFWKSMKRRNIQNPKITGLICDETHLFYDPKAEQLSDLLRKRGNKRNKSS